MPKHAADAGKEFADRILQILSRVALDRPIPNDAAAWLFGLCANRLRITLQHLEFLKSPAANAAASTLWSRCALLGEIVRDGHKGRAWRRSMDRERAYLRAAHRQESVIEKRSDLGQCFKQEDWDRLDLSELTSDELRSFYCRSYSEVAGSLAALTPPAPRQKYLRLWRLFETAKRVDELSFPEEPYRYMYSGPPPAALSGNWYRPDRFFTGFVPASENVDISIQDCRRLGLPVPDGVGQLGERLADEIHAAAIAHLMPDLDADRRESTGGSQWRPLQQEEFAGIQFKGGTVQRDGFGEVHLPNKLAEYFERILSAQGEGVDRSTVCEALWPSNGTPPFDRTLSRLNKKLAAVELKISQLPKSRDRHSRQSRYALHARQIESAI